MAQFIIGYLGNPPKPATPEEGAAHMGKWKAWMGSLGTAVVSPPTPLSNIKIVSADGVSDDAGPAAMTGYLVIEAADMDTALTIAKGDPYLDMAGGTLQVAQLMSMGKK
ncbi:MAG: hypothetical protein ACC619_00015 [Paracoccaceae bacterium]